MTLAPARHRMIAVERSIEVAEAVAEQWAEVRACNSSAKGEPVEPGRRVHHVPPLHRASAQRRGTTSVVTTALTR